MAQDARAIVAELKKYDPALHAKPRWLVLNKIDMVPAEEREQRVKDFVRRLALEGPGVRRSRRWRAKACEPLVRAVYEHVAQFQQQAPEPDPRFDAPGDGVG